MRNTRGYMKRTRFGDNVLNFLTIPCFVRLGFCVLNKNCENFPSSVVQICRRRVGALHSKNKILTYLLTVRGGRHGYNPITVYVIFILPHQYKFSRICYMISIMIYTCTYSGKSIETLFYKITIQECLIHLMRYLRNHHTDTPVLFIIYLQGTMHLIRTDI